MPQPASEFFNPVTVTGSYTANPGELVEANATSGAFSVTLPSAATCAGMAVAVKKTDSSANAVTIAATVDGTVNPTLATLNQAMTVESDGTSWNQISALAPNAVGAPTGTMRVLATTPKAGVAVINGTQTTLTWTSPTDGNLHTVSVNSLLVVSGATETGGQWTLNFTLNGAAQSIILHGAGKAVGLTNANLGIVCDPGTTVTVQQSSVLTNAGTSIATVYQSLAADHA